MPESLDTARSTGADMSLEQNGLLAAIRPEARSELSGAGTMVELRLGDLLRRIGQKAEHVWFPLSGMVSLSIPVGMTVQVGVVGREGVVGLSSLLDGGDIADEAVVQHPGKALRVDCTAFRKLIERDQSTMSAVLRYSHDLFALVSQSAACNGRHGLRQRLARWILLSHDYSDRGRMAFTQEVLATMLGVHRTSITAAAQYLRKQGGIQYSRSRLMVTNRALLEQLSCECYEALRSRIGNGARPFNHREAAVREGSKPVETARENLRHEPA